jgi:predicted nucleotide-binding protein
VHGRNERVRKEFFDFLRALDLDPIEWSAALAATGKASPYVGEILDRAFQSAKAVIVLLTPDDEVKLSEELWSSQEKDDEKQFHLQARPNVLFEAGMSFGRDPDHTLLIDVGTVKAFSDIGGRHILLTIA